MLYKFFIALSLVFSLQHATAQDIPLYEGAIPNSRTAPEGYAEKDSLGRIFRVTKPVLMPFFPREGKANGTAVLIFPGGGYFLLSMPACAPMQQRSSNFKAIMVFPKSSTIL